MRYQTLVLCSFAALVLPMVSCSGGNGDTGATGSDGARAVVRVTSEAVGKKCANGGSRIDYGRDTNKNKKLDDSEVTGSEYVCDGANGKNGEDASDGTNGVLSAVSISAEPAGKNCEHGGKRLDIGPDADGDGVPEIVTSTSYVCDGTNGTNGVDAAPLIVSVSSEDASDNCVFGGKRVDYGLDGDGDGVLGATEMLGTSYVCNGSAETNGTTALVHVTAIGAGQLCSAGGTQVDYGQDLNHNGTLEVSEIKGTRYVCQGTTGFSGSQTLVAVATEAPGASCAYGGKKVSLGLDLDRNSSLAASEVTSTSYVCNGPSALNGAPSLLKTTAEPAGANCANGGTKLDSGVDQNRDGTLQNGEITSTRYICNGANALDSATSAALVSTHPESPGANCANGGQRIDSGVDANGNSVLESVEVTDSDYVCNGANGANGTNGTNGTDGMNGAAGTNGSNALVVLTPEPAGAQCSNGGERIDTGLDASGDGVLQPAEIAKTTYVCNALAGTNGTNGSNGGGTLVAISIEPPGANCTAGGQRLESGIDANHDGVLAPGEVANTKYICNGGAGTNGAAGLDARNSIVAVVTEPPGANCVNGGDRVTAGVDANSDGVLAVGEVTSTRYVCNGLPGANGTAGANVSNTLVTVSAEPIGANCAVGGQRIDYGVDDNGDGTLGAAEFDGTRYVCNGVPGANGSNGSAGLVSRVNIAVEPKGTNCPGAPGGHRIQVGLDDNADGTLATGEVDSTFYVCDFAPLVNGSFETGDYTGWTLTGGLNAGIWANLANNTTVASGSTVFDYLRNATSGSLLSNNLPYTYHSTAGTRVAVAFQRSASNNHMYQVVTVPATATTLNWDMYYHSYATLAATQFLQVNMRNPNTSALVATLFQTTNGGTVNTTGDAIVAFSANVVALRGQTLRLDVEMNVQNNFFPAAFDNFRFQ